MNNNLSVTNSTVKKENAFQQCLFYLKKNKLIKSVLLNIPRMLKNATLYIFVYVTIKISG